MENSKGSLPPEGIPRWLQRRRPAAQRQLMIGEALRLDAAELFSDLAEKDRIRWNAPGKSAEGPEFEFKPGAPGIYVVRAQRGGDRRRVILTVGIRPRDLIDKSRETDFYFCLVARSGPKIHFLPLLQAPRKNAKERAKLVAREVSDGHPQFARLARAQTSIYRRRVMSRVYVEAGSIPAGLYAVFPNGALYLGSARPIEKATRAIAESIEALALRTAGRAELLATISAALASIDPTEFLYCDTALFPVAANLTGWRSPSAFISGVVNDLAIESARFGEQLGIGLGGDAMTAVFTFNSANATLSTRLFDGASGLSRQLSSTFDVFPPGSTKPAGLTLGAGTRGFPSASGAQGGRAGLSSLLTNFTQTTDGFGRGTSSVTGGFGGLLSSLGIGALGGSTGQAAMDTDGGTGGMGSTGSTGGTGGTPNSTPSGNQSMYASDGGGGGNTSGGAYWQETGGGTGYLVLGSSSPQETENRLNTGGEWAGGVNEDGDVIVVIIGGDPSGGGGDDTGGGDDGGGDTGGGDTGGGDTGGDDTGGGDTGGGDEGGGDTGGGDEGADDTGGGDEGGGDGPSGSGGGASIPVDDGTGGSGGGSGTTPLRGGIITRGGGYTDPNPEGGSGGNAGGAIRVIPGGGVTDPPDDETGGGGYRFWGGYNPPIGRERDPLINPVREGFAANAGAARIISNVGGVHVESFSGNGPGGYSVSGLMSLGLAEGMDAPGQAPGGRNP